MEIRFYKYNNPLGLKLGEKVNVKSVAHFDYETTKSASGRETISRKVFKQDQLDPSTKQPISRIGTVVGVKKKASEGTYDSGGWSGGWDGPSEYDPPTFTAKKYVWVYEVKFCLEGKISLVLPEDVELRETGQED